MKKNGKSFFSSNELFNRVVNMPTPPTPPPPPPPPDDPNEARLYRAWRIFHAKNPRIYQLVCQYADQAIKAGHQRYGIAGIWEVIRWEVTVRTVDSSDFKISNNHRAYYARLWNKEHPREPKFFDERELRSENPGGRRDEYGRDID